jgi:hypothetical protein
MTTQQAAVGYPNTASVLAIIGGCLMIAAGALILTVFAFVIPHLGISIPPGVNYSGSYNWSHWLFYNGTVSSQGAPRFIGGIVAAVGLFGLISGLVVLGSGVMLRTNPNHSVLLGSLILVFSVLSFFGSGGFVIGALMGIIGGFMTLTWKRPAASTQAQSGEKTA